MSEIGRVGIIGGGGWLGSAIAAALIRTGTLRPDDLLCSYRSKRSSPDLDCRWTQDNAELIRFADTIVICVRPQDWTTLDIAAPDRLIVSVMAGVPLNQIMARTGSPRCARALPNAAAELGYSYTPIVLKSEQGADRDVLATLFRSCGEVDFIDDEIHIDYFSAMSGSGAAFPALLASTMVDDAISRGVAREVAVRAAQQVLIGTGRLVEAHREAPAATVRSFVDYKGTIAAGITTMLDQGFDQSVRSGLETAFQAARPLSKE